MARKKKAPPEVHHASPEIPKAIAVTIAQVFIARRKIVCPHCGTTEVRRNGKTPETVAYFKCMKCVDETGAFSTFKLPVG